jgi:hypothetical protein
MALEAEITDPRQVVGLRSTPAGRPVYERLGSRSVESWQLWTAMP